jgi:hypothetical protein
LQLFQHLGNGDLAAAAVLLDRLKRLERLQRENHTDALERAERPLIKKVLISSLKKAQVPKADRQEDEAADREAIEAPSSATTPRAGQSILRKFIADELVDTLSAKLPSGTGRPVKTGISPLGDGPEFQ